MDKAARKNIADSAVSQLEEIILDVLHDAKGKCTGAADISRAAGIYRSSAEGAGGNIANFNDGITTTILGKLMAEGKVTRCPLGARQGWKLK